MQEELERYRSESMALCYRLMAKLDENRDEARSFFAGEILRSYEMATDKAKSKLSKIRNKLINL